eukprot:4619611-Pleurochrysis_carterae.AAC.2
MTAQPWPRQPPRPFRPRNGSVRVPLPKGGVQATLPPPHPSARAPRPAAYGSARRPTPPSRT